MGGGGSSWNIFNTDVSKKYKPLFNIIDPGGGLAKSASMVTPSQAEKTGLMTSSVNAKKDLEGIQAGNAKAIADAKAAQDLAASQAAERITQKKRSIARSQSVYTSPLGLSTEASTSRKTLLGQ
jgi:hypothetical protein